MLLVDLFVDVPALAEAGTTIGVLVNAFTTIFLYLGY
jgi:hypothetical protein